MFKSEEFRNLVKRFGFISLFLLVFFLVLSFFFTQLISQELFTQNAKIVSQIVSIHPELEEELMQALQEEGTINYELLEQYGYTKDNFLENTSSSLFWLLFGLGFGISFLLLVVVTVIYFIHLKQIYRKLDLINDYMQDVLNDRNPPKLTEYQEGVFSNLKNDIYKITNQLQEQKELLRKEKSQLEITLSDISHQLKTPLTSLYVINNLLEDDKLDSKMRHAFLKKNAQQLQRIEWLVTSLLKLSRLESGTVQLQRKKVKIQDLLTEALDPLQIPMELKKQTLTLQGDKNTSVLIDFHWTVEAISNIIKNAHEHTPEEGHISLSWEDNPLYVLLTIQDDGEGIDKKDLPHIFERFFKGSHNAKESIGIGLNMSRQILMREDAIVRVESKKQEGTKFFIYFMKRTI